jgi:hypothetical protein
VAGATLGAGKMSTLVSKLASCAWGDQTLVFPPDKAATRAVGCEFCIATDTRRTEGESPERRRKAMLGRGAYHRMILYRRIRSATNPCVPRRDSVPT